MHKKRGQYHLAAVILIPAISLVLVLGVFYLDVLADIMGIQETTYFEKNFIAGDMATIINTLYASPGNTIVYYNKNTSHFSYEFNKDKVAVFDETETLKTKTSYPIIADHLYFDKITLNAEFEGKDKSRDNVKRKVQPVFAKVIDTLSVNKVSNFNKNINKLECTNTETIQDAQSKAILIDAGHGGQDEGETANNIKEKDITGKIGFSLYNLKKTGKHFTRDDTPDINKQTRKDEFENKDKIINNVNNIGIIISIHTGAYDDNSNNVKAYYSIESNEETQKKSRRLACKVLNELITKEDLKISGISMIGINPEDYEGGEILVKDKIAVIFEIGNIKNQKSIDIITNAGNIQSISDSIIEGLKKC